MAGDFANPHDHHPQNPRVRSLLRAAGLLFAGFVVLAMAIGTQHAQRELRIQKEERSSRDLPPVNSDEPLMPSYSAPAAPRAAPVATPSDNDLRNARNLAPPLPTPDGADFGPRPAGAAPPAGPSAAREAPALASAPARASIEGRTAERALVTGIEQYGPSMWEVRVRTEGGEAVRLRMRNPPRFNVGARVRFSDERIERE